MFFVFEISRPIQWKPFAMRSPGVTTFRVVWLWFALSLHPMTFGEMVNRTGKTPPPW